MIGRLLARLTPPRGRQLPLRGLLGLCALAFCLYAITAIPYVLAYVRTPPGWMFAGVLIYPEDQDAYASFIRQAADGHFLFVNRLTSLDHGPAFFNLEWLCVGRLTGWLQGSTIAAYQVWRAAGALSVVLGFSALAYVVLPGRSLRRIALLMCVFGGGFQVISLALNGLSGIAEKLLGVHAGLLPTEFFFFTTHPFAQILVNPHFSLPLGIFMAAVAAYVHGERTGAWRWYAGAGALAAIEGLMRPYEMIALYTTLPLFALVEMLVARRFEARRLGLRMLPLLLVAPVFLYTVYIFEFHPIFKYWASQGYVDPLPFTTHFAHMGLAGVLFAIRLCLVKKYPFKTPVERFLLVWLATVFFFVHANSLPLLRFMPYTPQLMTSLMPPMILLGAVVLDPAQWGWAAGRRALALSLIVAFLCVNALDSAVLLDTLSPKGTTPDPQIYIPDAEMQAYRWLDREASEDDVVLCLNQTGHRLAKFASVRVVSGHWSVTPESEKMEGSAERFYAGAVSLEAAAEFLRQCRVKWIYLGPNERRWGRPNMDLLPGFKKRVINDDVTVYSAQR